MPELPEVETVVKHIQKKVSGSIIKDCSIYNSYTNVILGQSLFSLKKKVKDQKILKVIRRGKQIVFILEQGVLTIHLRMTGQLLIATAPPKHTTFTFEFAKNKLHFVDVRKFGKIRFYKNYEDLDKSLGIEPLSNDFTSDYLLELLTNHKRQIKPFLLDQSYIVGLGNIYADEVLFAAGIHPQKNTNSISKQKSDKLHKAIKQVLKKSIDYQGTTFINFQFDNAKEGNFQKLLKVFNQTGKPCKKCKTIIKKIKVAQRGTHFCPKCQRK